MEMCFIKLLPTKMISKDEINGEKIDYEEYLTDIVNFSEYFMKLSDREKFIRIKKQDNGQADIKTNNYELDFKLLVNQDFINYKLKSLPDVDYSNSAKGFVCVNDKSNKGDVLTQARANGLFAVFFNEISQVTKEQLEDGDKNKNSKLYSTIKMFKKRKNLFFFLPIEVNCPSDDSVVNTVTRLTNIFSLRDNIHKDTFVTLLRKNSDVYDEFYILKYENGKFHIIDKIPKLLITSFNEIYRLTSFTENIN